jgi:hypothetical protein
MDQEGLPLEVYDGIINKWAEITAHWKCNLPQFLDNDAQSAVSRLALMTHAADIKALAEEKVGA